MDNKLQPKGAPGWDTWVPPPNRWTDQSGRLRTDVGSMAEWHGATHVNYALEARLAAINPSADFTETLKQYQGY